MDVTAVQHLTYGHVCHPCAEDRQQPTDLRLLIHSACISRDNFGFAVSSSWLDRAVPLKSDPVMEDLLPVHLYFAEVTIGGHRGSNSAQGWADDGGIGYWSGSRRLRARLKGLEGGEMKS